MTDSEEKLTQLGVEVPGHGHSFRVRVTVDGEPDAETGQLIHFDELKAALDDLRGTLDHNFLNDIEGLENPTLELISKWLWDSLHNRVPGLAEIAISRDTCYGYPRR